MKSAITSSRCVAPVPGSEDQVVGRRFIQLIEDELRCLRAHHGHHNRALFFDHVIVAHLIAFFNPAMKSLRKIEDVFDLRLVRKRFAAPRVPRSTLADAQRLFDPQLVIPLIGSLKKRLAVHAHDARLDALTQQLLAVDGTFFAVAPRIAWALYNSTQTGSVRVHVHFDILQGVPEHVTLTAGRDGEGRQLQQALQANRFYVVDRGFQSYELIRNLIGCGSDFVVRLRKTASCEIVDPRPLTAEDRAAGITGDGVVRIGWRDDQTPNLPPLRRVAVTTTDRQGQTATLILLTNRLDLSAAMIALIYQHRWQIELFFRWLKCMACFKHFFSESQQGMTLQVYVAVLGTLLMAVGTGAKPNSYDYNLMAFAVNGDVPLEDVLEHLNSKRSGLGATGGLSASVTCKTTRYVWIQLAIAVAAIRRADRERAALKDRERRLKKLAR